MSCNKHHAIEIVKSFGESCERTNLLINGVIRNICDCDKILIRVNEIDKFEAKISANKRFKQIISLKENTPNLIDIRYCTAKLSLQVLQNDPNNSFLQRNNDDQLLFDVQPLYLIPEGHDGKFQTTADDTNNSADAALRKIDLIIDLVKLVISTKVFESYGDERCFVTRKCEAWFSPNLCLDAMRDMTQWEAYDAVADDIIKTFGEGFITRRKFIVFMSSTYFDGLSEGEVQSQQNIAAKTWSDAALGGGFLCLMGSGSFFSLPENMNDVMDAFDCKKIVDTTQVIDNSNYRGTYGGCFATFLGSLIHEIGHVFDLAHTESGLMGNDIDYVHRFFLPENLTEVLPKRNVKNCSLVDNRDNSKQVNQRLTKIRKPGEFMEKYHEQKNNEMTFFVENCMVTLYHHKWFTQNVETSELEFSLTNRSIQSLGSPLALVELRKKPDENSLLVHFWSFCDETINKFLFPTNINLSNRQIFAITRDGSIFKN